MLKNNTNTTAFKTTRWEHQRLIFKFRTVTLCLENNVFPKENPASFEVLFLKVSIIKVWLS